MHRDIVTLTSTTPSLPSLIMSDLQLPVELWRKIFRYATFVPGIFDTCCRPLYWHYHWRRDHNHDFEFFKSLRRKALPTKLALSTVCKLWRDIALELLFEIFIIHPNTFVASRRVRSLDVLGPPDSSATLSPLRFVRRREIFELVAARSGDITRVVKRCTQFQVYRNLERACPEVSSLSFLLHNRSPTIRYLHLGVASLPLGFADILATSLRNIEMLSTTQRLEGESLRRQVS
jgi:hypothetical protein